MNRSILLAIVLILPLLTASSCAADPQTAAVARMKKSRAKDKFVDTRDVRLAEAVALGDRAAIDAAIKAGGNVNARSDKGEPMLLWALAKDSVAGFDALLGNGADLKALVNDPAFTRKGERTREFIELLASANKPEFLRLALEHGFDPDYVADSYMNQSLLFRAIWANSISNAGTLLDAGADIDFVDANKNTPLIQAMNINHYEMVHFLLTRGADPNIPNKSGHGLPGLMKEYGTRGVTEREFPHFVKVVTELKKRRLITDEDIKNADNKQPFSDPEP
jgi:uncharacterized protein